VPPSVELGWPANIDIAMDTGGKVGGTKGVLLLELTGEFPIDSSRSSTARNRWTSILKVANTTRNLARLID